MLDLNNSPFSAAVAPQISVHMITANHGIHHVYLNFTHVLPILLILDLRPFNQNTWLTLTIYIIQEACIILYWLADADIFIQK